MRRSIYLGFDPREAAAFAVARHSIQQRLSVPIPVHGVVLPLLTACGAYQRPTTFKPGGGMIDYLSARDEYDGSCATQFSISRFFVMELERMKVPRDHGWVLFADSDILALDNLVRLFDEADERYAVMCVKHNHQPINDVKMDGQRQTRYHRKNWSSVMLFNMSHPSNQKLDLGLLNTAPGRDLHAFCWLSDDEIGELSPRWNYLVGHSTTAEPPGIVHFTDGTPDMAGYEECEFAELWRTHLSLWAR